MQMEMNLFLQTHKSSVIQNYILQNQGGMEQDDYITKQQNLVL